VGLEGVDKSLPEAVAHSRACTIIQLTTVVTAR
jgi:hypothetical protein